MEDKKIEFSVSMSTKYLFEFLYINSYSGFRGILNYAFSAIGIVALIFGFGDSVISKVFLIVLSLLFTVIDPLLLFFKAFQQAKLNPAFKKPINYGFSKEAIFVSQGEEKQEAPWEMILLVKESLGSLILFTGNNNAVILPKEAIGDKLSELKALLHEMRPQETAKLK